jgi:ribosomal protein S19
MSRSLWKGVYLTSESLRFKKHKYKIKGRSVEFLPIHFNKFFHIYNGKQYVSIRVNKDGMVGHKVGEFCFTKKKCVKVKKDKKNFKLKK